ncbi:MAG: SDR family NAD(P)-dependent oxidoreductase [Parvularculaceae bacterium]|nr:SDR family NAD(P)-dependent oxidoreductase [Parvularculaceae bacterium]
MVSFTSPLVIGASGGIGAAIAARLPNAERLSRRDSDLDITNEASVRGAAARLNPASFDLIFIATGVLESDGARPEKSFAELGADAMARVFAANAIGPALVFKHFASLLPVKERSVIAFLSARVGSIGDNRLGGWMSYRASKAALNQIVRCASAELKRTRPEAIALALHPGTIDTALTRKFAGGRFTATPEECAENLLRVCAQATPEMSGRFFAYDGTEIVW